ncbi:MAG: hypothetical protein Q4C49_03895 [Bacillota bacterium]|nr:hypothetical protein [Bacillota bacterium]
MKKFLSTIFVALFVMVTMVSVTGCSKTKVCTTEYTEAKEVELVAYDDGMDNISVEGNKVKCSISKEATFEVQVRVDGEEDFLSISHTKQGYTVESKNGFTVIVKVE